MFSSLVIRIRQRLFGKRRVSTIDPDEVFLDAHNLPEFDTSQFEGRIEKPIKKYTFVILSLSLFFLGFVILGRLFILQIVDGEVFAKESEQNRLHHSLIFAERGVIYGRDGTELAWNVPSENDDFSRRQYMPLSGLAHVLGYIQTPLKDERGFYYRTELVGLSGAEKSFDEVLRGENGIKIVETDVFSKVQSESILSPPKDGESLTLSIDVELQRALYEFIENLAQDAAFVGGAGVIMDVETGELVALASYPEYSPNDLSGGEDQERIVSYVRDERKPFLNRAVSGLYTPGSIIKPFLALGALQEGIIDEDETILSTGSISIPNPYVPGEFSVFKDWKAHGEVNMREAIAVSSNVYFFELGGGLPEDAAARAHVPAREGLGIANVERYVRHFGIGEKSGVDVPAEEKGIVPSPRWKKANFEDGTWRLGDTYNTSIGQYGFQITPIQAVRAVAAIANGGTLLTPTVVLGGNPQKKNIPIAAEHFEVVKEGMRRAVTEGTGTGLYLPHISIAAKTGTAEVGSQKQYVNSWAIGFFPYENPKYAFAVIMERGPAGNLTGAVFIMRELLEWISANRPSYVSIL